ncbi:MAG: GNAT family N-acetyltransferase [Deltaproteobacteria bacterium]|nr:GNAT family N-acetyltransferase [Deltaproteobacteria bacterium]
MVVGLVAVVVAIVVPRLIMSSPPIVMVPVPAGVPVPIRIREIDRGSSEEVELVASRMRETMVKVLGVERGTTMYSMDWLVQRVRWHLDPENTNGRVFLAEEPSRKIVGHAIARIDPAEAGHAFGYLSTVFVEPRMRNQGVATLFLEHVERWFREMKMPKII